MDSQYLEKLLTEYSNISRSYKKEYNMVEDLLKLEFFIRYLHQQDIKLKMTKLQEYFEVLRFKKGENVIDANNKPRSIYIILRGKIALYLRKTEKQIANESYWVLEREKKDKIKEGQVHNDQNIVKHFQNSYEEELLNIYANSQLNLKGGSKLVEKSVCFFRFYKNIKAGETFGCYSKYLEGPYMVMEDSYVLSITSMNFERIFQSYLVVNQYLQKVIESQLKIQKHNISLTEITAYFQKRQCKSGELLYTYSQNAQKIFILEEGDIKLYKSIIINMKGQNNKIIKDKQEVEIYSIQEGEIFGHSEIYQKGITITKAITTKKSIIHEIDARIFEQYSDIEIFENLKKSALQLHQKIILNCLKIKQKIEKQIMSDKQVKSIKDIKANIQIKNNISKNDKINVKFFENTQKQIEENLLKESLPIEEQQFFNQNQQQLEQLKKYKLQQDIETKKLQNQIKHQVVLQQEQEKLLPKQLPKDHLSLHRKSASLSKIPGCQDNGIVLVQIEDDQCKYLYNNLVNKSARKMVSAKSNQLKRISMDMINQTQKLNLKDQNSNQNSYSNLQSVQPQKKDHFNVYQNSPGFNFSPIQSNDQKTSELNHINFEKKQFSQEKLSANYQQQQQFQKSSQVTNEMQKKQNKSSFEDLNQLQNQPQIVHNKNNLHQSLFQQILDNQQRNKNKTHNNFFIRNSSTHNLQNHNSHNNSYSKQNKYHHQQQNKGSFHQLENDSINNSYSFNYKQQQQYLKRYENISPNNKQEVVNRIRITQSQKNLNQYFNYQNNFLDNDIFTKNNTLERKTSHEINTNNNKNFKIKQQNPITPKRLLLNNNINNKNNIINRSINNQNYFNNNNNNQTINQNTYQNKHFKSYSSYQPFIKDLKSNLNNNFTGKEQDNNNNNKNNYIQNINFKKTNNIVF